MYAGFWARALALFLDILSMIVILLVLWVPFLALSPDIFNILRSTDAPFPDILKKFWQALPAWILIISSIPFLVQAVLPATQLQASLGKLMLGLMVVTAHDGGPIGYPRAIFRSFCTMVIIPIACLWINAQVAFLPAPIMLFISYAMAGLNSQKCALHDVLAGTRIIFGRANLIQILDNTKKTTRSKEDVLFDINLHRAGQEARNQPEDW